MVDTDEQLANEDDPPATGKPAPAAHQFRDLNEVPVPWRTHRGAQLNLAQVNGLIQRGQELGYWLEHENGDPYFVPDEGRARDEFRAQHEVINGMWVPKARG